MEIEDFRIQHYKNRNEFNKGTIVESGERLFVLVAKLKDYYIAFSHNQILCLLKKQDIRNIDYEFAPSDKTFLNCCIDIKMRYLLKINDEKTKINYNENGCCKIQGFNFKKEDEEDFALSEFDQFMVGWFKREISRRSPYLFEQVNISEKERDHVGFFDNDNGFLIMEVSNFMNHESFEFDKSLYNKVLNKNKFLETCDD